MFHTFSHSEKNIKLHIIEIGNKELKHAVIFFMLEVETFFSIINKLSLDYFRVVLIYRCDVLSREFLLKEFEKGIQHLIDHLNMESTHCILESGLDDIYKTSLCSRQIFDFTTVCKTFDEFSIEDFFRLYPRGHKDSVGFIEKVNEQINETLSEGEPYLFKVAKKMRLTPRVLSKKIITEGEEFKALVKQKRYEKALILLQDKDVSLSDIAYTLGYTEHSAFTRAFRGWTGCSPGQFRKYFR